MIPVIDLFAGPGGLGEGFSTVYSHNSRFFKIKLSIEKNKEAHKTLELRSFFRQFDKDKVPEEYYQAVRETNLTKREVLIKELYSKYPLESSYAQKESWLAELGSPEFPSKIIDQRIKKSLGNAKNWVLIGGPPCQAYSLVGRSRVGGIAVQDHRVYLYKEYLRIIAYHKPSVFVMENVEGLLSAKIRGEKVFEWILGDLRDPSSVYKDSKSPKYRIFSLTTATTNFDQNRNPLYKEHRDFLILSEKFGIPQKRHRVILLGIREDIRNAPEILEMKDSELKLKDIIGDLPKIRSGLNRSFVSSYNTKDKIKRIYRNEEDTDENWMRLMNSLRSEITNWNGFKDKLKSKRIQAPQCSVGSEYIKYKTPSLKNPLYEWYYDRRMKGVSNHVSRTHLVQDLRRYMFASMFTEINNHFPLLKEYYKHTSELLPDHVNAKSGKFTDRFRVQLPDKPATTITSHISKDGHYFIHYDCEQCRSLTVREAARIQTFPDNYLFRGSRTAQFHQVGNAVPPYLAFQIAETVKKIFMKKNSNTKY